MKNLRHEGGFTLIELIMVIVILGLLAAVAIPKFTDMSTEAQIASEKGMVGGVKSGIATLHAGALGKNSCGGVYLGATMTALPGCWPSVLDAVADPAVNSAGLFGDVLEQGGTTSSDNWSKPTATTYTGPATDTWTYDNTTGSITCTAGPHC